ncbi:meprin A subunit beta [Pimephales promelas]|nr:meprin A subunit beta [Pimephales promelas]
MHVCAFLLLSFAVALGHASDCLFADSSISFLDHCSFDDESLCQMRVCSAAEYGWQRLKSVSGINVTDHSYLGKEQNGTSFFMHFSTEGRNQGDSARLESKTLTPTRDCKVQCLQFYYYHSGDESESSPSQLNIWIREYQDEADSRGTLRLMDRVTETPGNYWKLHHVQLNANTSFQVVFEGRKGAGNSSGGFSLDDINVSETECPFFTWQRRDFEKLGRGYGVLSPEFYSSDGYRFEAAVLLLMNSIEICVSLKSGANDEQLQKQITVQILDQNPHIQKRMSVEQSITTDTELTYKDGQENCLPLSRDDLARREFIKGGDLIILFSMQGLLERDSLPCPKVTVKNFNVSTDTSALNEGPCASR